jgi:hypothetical protein
VHPLAFPKCRGNGKSRGESGLPNISSAGNPISLPNIIILGVYPVLLFTEDLNAPANVIEKLTPYLYKIKLKRVIITANHDRLKLCHDREVPEWAQKLSQQIIKGTGYTKEKGGGGPLQ